MVVEGYAQDEWVTRQHYQDAPWPELVLLWQLYNRHLARLMSVTPVADRTRIRTVHNLNERGFGAIPREVPVTLELLMINFVDHLEHHLAQVQW
jgi:hypothetical protein